MVFECPRCGKTDEYKNNMRKHFKRKKECKSILSNTTQEECLNMLEKNEFVSITLLKTQLNHAMDQLNKKDKQIGKLQEQMDILVKAQGKNLKGSHNSNCNNDTTIINVHVNSYENTNYTVLKDNLNNCIKNGKVDESKLLKLLHFNKDHPENHNIKIDNRRDNRIMTFNGTEFEEKHSGKEGVWEFIEETIGNAAEKENISDELQASLDETHTKYEDTTKEDKRKKIQDISKVLYNGRKLVDETHSKDQKIIH